MIDWLIDWSIDSLDTFDRSLNKVIRLSSQETNYFVLKRLHFFQGFSFLVHGSKLNSSKSSVSFWLMELPFLITASNYWKDPGRKVKLIISHIMLKMRPEKRDLKDHLSSIQNRDGCILFKTKSSGIKTWRFGDNVSSLSNVNYASSTTLYEERKVGNYIRINKNKQWTL